MFPKCASVLVCDVQQVPKTNNALFQFEDTLPPWVMVPHSMMFLISYSTASCGMIDDLQEGICCRVQLFSFGINAL